MSILKTMIVVFNKSCRLLSNLEVSSRNIWLDLDTSFS